MAAEERRGAHHVHSQSPPIEEEDAIDYGFLSMRFKQPYIEQAYRTYFAHTQADSDIFWSTLSTFLAAMLIRRLKDVTSPDDFWFAVKCFLIVTIPPNSFVYFLAKARPDDHARVRTPALLVFKAARGVVMRWIIQPHKMAERFAAAAARGSAKRLLPAAVLHSIQLAFYSWGFRLPSREQAPFTLWLAILWFWGGKLGDPLFSCAAFAGPQSADWADYGAFCPKIKSFAAQVVPVYAWNGLDRHRIGATDVPALGQPCLIVCLWIALVLAFFLPVTISNLAEEKCRRAFLAQRSAEAPLKPPVLLAVANAAAAIAMFAAIAYGALEELGRWNSF